MIEFAVASRPMPGQDESGDGYIVREYPARVVVAVVDGLGHGPEAAVAMRVAIESLQANASETVAGLVGECHQRLRATRGVVLGIASLDFTRGAMSWLGVGNIAGILIHTEASQIHEQTLLLSRNGVVGHNLPTLQTVTQSVSPGDTLVFATDGVSEEFLEGMRPARSTPGQLAQQIMDDYALDTDDALVLVVRYLGAAGEP